MLDSRNDNYKKADFEAWLGSDGILAGSKNEIKDAVAQMCAICDEVESAKAKGNKIKVSIFRYAIATRNEQSAKSLD